MTSTTTNSTPSDAAMVPPRTLELNNGLLEDLTGVTNSYPTAHMFWEGVKAFYEIILEVQKIGEKYRDAPTEYKLLVAERDDAEKEVAELTARLADIGAEQARIAHELPALIPKPEPEDPQPLTPTTPRHQVAELETGKKHKQEQKLSTPEGEFVVGQEHAADPAAPLLAPQSELSIQSDAAEAEGEGDDIISDPDALANFFYEAAEPEAEAETAYKPILDKQQAEPNLLDLDLLVVGASGSGVGVGDILAKSAQAYPLEMSASHASRNGNGNGNGNGHKRPESR
jgi:hypothetical protein